VAVCRRALAQARVLDRTMRRILLRIGDYIFVTRPLILIPAWSFYLLGASAGRDRTAVAPPAFYYGFLCLTAILITAYLLNQIFDRESDRRNDKGHFLTRGIFKVRTAVFMAAAAFLCASYLFRSAGETQRTPLVAALVLSLVYSLPPLRLVARPVLDLLANAVGYAGVAYAAGYTAWGASSADAAARSIPYVALVGATFLHTTILDADGDAETGKITTTVAIGVARSAVLSGVLAASGWVWSLAVSLPAHGDWVAAVLLTLAIFVFASAAVRIARRPAAATAISSNAVQGAVAVVCVPAAIAWPWYLLLVVPVVVLSRFYYRARFGINYPGPSDRQRSGVSGSTPPPR